MLRLIEHHLNYMLEQASAGTTDYSEGYADALRGIQRFLGSEVLQGLEDTPPLQGDYETHDLTTKE